MKNKLSIGVLALLLCVAGCSSIEKRAQKLHLGMSEQQVVDLLGSDYTVAASRLDANNMPLRVIKYDIKKSPALYLYFRQNKLVQWGDVEVLQAMPPGGAPPKGQAQ